MQIAQAALMRVIEKRPPSGRNNEQFRDCCIWEHCVRAAKQHTVHLITADGHFYEGGKPENGLAEPLMRELRDQGVGVLPHLTLPKLIEHLAPSVPARDAERLGRDISEAARPTLEHFADAAGFSLGGLTAVH